MGFEAIIPPYNCCGRPLISKGFLDEAKASAEKLINLLYPYAEQGLPIIGIEPSCILTIADDYKDLIPSEKSLTVANSCLSIDQFLAENTNILKELLHKKGPSREIKFHRHCHQKALESENYIQILLDLLPHVNASETQASCCGQAGAFGYEEEHHEFSMKIAESRLLPELREIGQNTTVIANGLSCRCQINYATQMEPLHLVQVIEGILAGK